MITVFFKFFYVFFILILSSACNPFAIKETQGRLDYYMFPEGQHKINSFAPTEKEYADTPIINKNYSVGNQNVAFMGRPMISFKNTLKRDTNQVLYDKVRLTEDVNLRGGVDLIKLKKDNIYDLIGFMEIDNEIFDVMKVSHNEGILITRRATISGRVVRLEKGRVNLIGHIYVPTPSNAKVVAAVTEQGVENVVMSDFEIIYSGIKDNRFYLTLMDNTKNYYYATPYNRDGLQSGVYQTFAYDLNTTFLSIAGLDIRILGVHHDKIDFIVLSDDVATSGYLY